MIFVSLCHYVFLNSKFQKRLKKRYNSIQGFERKILARNLGDTFSIAEFGNENKVKTSLEIESCCIIKRSFSVYNDMKILKDFVEKLARFSLNYIENTLYNDPKFSSITSFSNNIIWKIGKQLIWLKENTF